MNRQPRAPSVLWCIVALAVIKWHLKHRPFVDTWRLAAERPIRAPARPSIDDDWLARVVHQVTVAAALYPGRALCLEQSLALCLALRRRGVAAECRLGVQPFRFRAHAWVELTGRVLNDTPERLVEFVVLPNIQA